MIGSLVQLAVLALAVMASAVAQERPPWVVVDAPEMKQWDELRRPALVVLPDGSYVAKYEHEGHYSNQIGTRICVSRDRGATWERVATLDVPRLASLLAIGERLYLLGVDGSGRTPRGHVVIRRSDDGGRTWTAAVDEATGRIRGESELESASVPSVIAAGRIWRPFARSFYRGATRAHALLASAPVDADLLRADSWRWSEELPLAEPEAPRVAGSYLIDDGAGPPRLVLRSFGFDCVGVALPSADGWKLALDERDPSITVPRNARGWEPRRDPLTQRWFALVNPKPVEESKSAFDGGRVELMSSSDAVTWDVRSTLLDGGAGYNERSWVYAGADLDVVACISKKDGQRVVFLRVLNFRERTSETAPVFAAPSKAVPASPPSEPAPK